MQQQRYVHTYKCHNTYCMTNVFRIGETFIRDNYIAAIICINEGAFSRMTVNDFSSVSVGIIRGNNNNNNKKKEFRSYGMMKRSGLQYQI